MPSKKIPRLNVPLEDRVRNKDGTIKRFYGERFVGDEVMTLRYDYKNHRWINGKVTEVISDRLIKVEGYDHAIDPSRTVLIKKGA